MLQRAGQRADRAQEGLGEGSMGQEAFPYLPHSRLLLPVLEVGKAPNVTGKQSSGGGKPTMSFMCTLTLELPGTKSRQA